MSKTDFTGRQLEVIAVSDVHECATEYLLSPYIPVGKITVLEGDPASGKTFVALALASAVTTGIPIEPGTIPVGEISTDGIPRASKPVPVIPPANVLYFTAEDDVADTIKPRFRKLDGDPERLLTVPGIIQERDGEKYRSNFKLTNVAELKATLVERQPRLLVIDPLQGFLGANVDLHRSNEVRPILASLGKLAAEHRCAVLIIRHLNKAGQGKSAYRGMGSIDITAAARSVLLAGKHPRFADRFAIVHTKSSIGRTGPALQYAIDDSGLSWVGEDESLFAEELLGPRVLPSRSKEEQGKDFLRQMLANGPKSSKEVMEAAAAQGISSRTLDRARTSLGVQCKPAGYQAGWEYSLGPERVSASVGAAELSSNESPPATP